MLSNHLVLFQERRSIASYYPTRLSLQYLTYGFEAHTRKQEPAWSLMPGTVVTTAMVAVVIKALIPKWKPTRKLSQTSTFRSMLRSISCPQRTGQLQTTSQHI